MSVVTSLVTRVDSWINAMTGLGTLRDKLVYTQPVSGAKLGDGALESLFNDDDIARRICAKLPREAMRRGFRIELEGDDESEDADDIGRLMDDQLMLLGAIPKLRDSWIWARLYGGGCGVFVGADDGQSPEQPLNEEGIRTISFLNVVKRPLLTIKTRFEDVTSPQFGEPELYSIATASTGLGVVTRAGIDIHASRMILFEGAMTAQQTFQSPTGWQDSVLQNAYAALQQSATAWQSVAHLMTDASQGVLKIANLVDLIASGGQDALRTRIQMMDMARSVARAILVDAEKESFERVSTSFAGLPEVMDKLMMRVAAAAEQPVTLLFGRSAAGMNATGESDISGWYDTVADAQTDILKPRLERLLRLMFAAKDSPTRGRVPERWCVEFNPLWQPTDKELADTLKVKADTHVALVGAGIMTDAEAGIGLAQDFPTINVEHREELMEADLEEGLRPGEINAPEPPLDPNADPAADGDGPPRTDAMHEDAQARAPAGSSIGGQWVSTGGGGGTASKKKEPHAKLTAAEREAIRAGVKSGALVAGFDKRIAAKYGAGKAGALAWEREIKARMKTAKAQRAAKNAGEAEHKALLKTAGARAADDAAMHARSALEAGHIIAHAKSVADKSGAAAIAAQKKAETAAKISAGVKAAAAKKKAAALAAKQAEEAAKPVVPAWKLADQKAAASLEAKIAAYKAELASATEKYKAAGGDMAALAKPPAKAVSAAKHSFEAQKKAMLTEQSAAKKAKKAAADAKKNAAKTAEFIKPDTVAQGQLSGVLLKSADPVHMSKHASASGLQRTYRGPLKVKPSPHGAAFDDMAKTHASSFKVVEGVVGKATAELGHEWKSNWVGSSTERAAKEVLDGIDDPKHHAHAQYHATQSLLKQHLPEMQKRGIVDADGYVTLYRGVKSYGQGKVLEQAFDASKDGSTAMRVRGASSWSASHEVARGFAHAEGTVVQQKVHYSNALVVHNFEPKWGLKEIEWTLVARDERFQVVRGDELVKDPYNY